MNRLIERRIVEKRIEKMQQQVQNIKSAEIIEPICIKLHKPVLYYSEANEAVRENAYHVWTQNYESRPNVVRLVKYLGSYYWMTEYYYLACLVRIGVESECLIVPISFATQEVEYVNQQRIEVFVKDCRPQTNENTSLVVWMDYDHENNDFVPVSLVLKGEEIRNFPHSYWDVRTFVSNGAEDSQCSGMITSIDEKTFFGQEVVKVERVSLWKGIKILRPFSKDEADYTIEQMLNYWHGFWEVNGY